jgi:uncharacterized RDD family membrane protein YckC
MSGWQDPPSPGWQTPPGPSPGSFGGPPGRSGGGPGGALASWGRRALALIVDALALVALSVPGVAVIGLGAAADSDRSGPDQPNGVLVALGVALAVGGVVVQFWQQGWRQGSRGQSWGKQALGIRLVRLADGVPPGGGIGLGRMLLRMVFGNVSCGIYTVLTYLWPLWDDNRQTLDDKIFSTVVVVGTDPAHPDRGVSSRG